MTKGKIVLVPFPFDDLSASKVRPALCLTNPVGPYRHVIVAFITSQEPKDIFEADLVFKTNDPDFAATGLRVASVLRLHRLTTLPANLIQRELGDLSTSKQKQVAEKLSQLFELTLPEKL